MSNTEKPERHNALDGWTSRRAVIRTVMIFPLVFGLFHFFIFAFWYYWPISPAIPLVLVSGLFSAAVWRLTRYIPFPRDRRMAALMPRAVPGPSRLAAIEISGWYALLVALYAHVVQRFGFPGTVEAAGWRVIAYGYGAYFAFALLVNPIFFASASAVNSLFSEMRLIRRLLARVIAVSGLYVLVDVFFAALFRLMSALDPSAFKPGIASFVDALYFSTITLATVGYGDILPASPAAKLIVVAEVFAGVIVLAVVFATAISLSFASGAERVNEELRPAAERIVAANGAAQASSSVNPPEAPPHS